MSTENGEVYIMLGDDDEEWVHPTPAKEAIRDAITAATDLDEVDIEAVDTHLDMEKLREVLEGETESEYTFTVEDHDVTVGAGGKIAVE